jgi:hypothetical protein
LEITRMKTVFLFSAIALFVVSSIYAADGGAAAASREDGGTVRAGRTDFPRLSLNQTRPRPKVECLTCEEQPPFDGGWVPGGCNCRRNCVSGQTGCSLSTNNQCKADEYSGSCTSCLNTDCT